MQDTTFFDRPPTLPNRTILHPLVQQIEQAWPADQWRGVHLLLAVSGGADSVALLRAMLELKDCHGGSGQLLAAHLHHGLRGAEADEDQRWVAELCGDLGVRLWTSRAEIAEADASEGWEAAARAARYRFLTCTAEQVGARYVATAHTKDDQVETVLHRVLRGTGLEGLAGIRAARPLTPSVTLIRPMLSISRAEVVSYLHYLRQDFRTDSSNASSQFTRNWLRNKLLPMIRNQLNRDVDGALLRLSQQARDVQQTLTIHVDRLIESYTEITQNAENGMIGEFRVSCRPLRAEPALVIQELCKRIWQRLGWPLRDVGYDQWRQLADFVLAGDGPAVMLPGAVRAEVRDGVLVLRRGDPS